MHDDASSPKGPRCSALAKVGTGTGTCDALLDPHGNCPRTPSHIEDHLLYSSRTPSDRIRSFERTGASR